MKSALFLTLLCVPILAFSGCLHPQNISLCISEDLDQLSIIDECILFEKEVFLERINGLELEHQATMNELLLMVQSIK